MSETAEAQAEEAIFAMVMAPEGGEIERPEEMGAVEEGEQEEETEQPTQAKQAEAETKAAEPQEDFIEIPGENEDDEPTRLKVADVLADYQEYQAFKAERANVLNRVESEAIEHFNGRYKEVEEFSKQASAVLQATLQLIAPPQPPSRDMLNPASPNYNPDGFNLAMLNYQDAMAIRQQAEAWAKEILGQADEASQKQNNERWSREKRLIAQHMPELTKQEGYNKFISDLKAAYRYSDEELDAALNDHRQFLVARDALAFRAMKAQGKDVKKQVEAKAPKLVRTNTEAKSGGAKARDAGGRFVGDAKATAMRSRSDADWARYFTEGLKSGRIG